MDGTTSLGTRPIVGSKAKLTISTLPQGRDSITVLYPGNAFFVGSVSPILVETIGQTKTKAQLSSSRKSSTYGQAVEFSATVSAGGNGGPAPPGWISFFDGSTMLQMVPMSDGKATFTTGLLSAGKHTIRVAYNGSGGFGPSAASVKQTVKQAKTSIAKSSMTMFEKTGVIASGKLEKGGRDSNSETFHATLRVNESRPAELGQQPEASLAWGRATVAAKRR